VRAGVLGLALAMASCGSPSASGDLGASGGALASGGIGSSGVGGGGAGASGGPEALNLGSELTFQCDNFRPEEDERCLVTGIECQVRANGRVGIDISTECSLLQVASVAELGSHTTARSNNSVFSSCSMASSFKNEEPCTITVEELVGFGEAGQSSAEAAGSKVTMTVDCPEGLARDGGDDVGLSRRRLSPSAFRVTAADCAVE
jgi:hypothetical protein